MIRRSDNIKEYTPTLNSDNAALATKQITQFNTTDKVLLGASQGIGNAILTTPLVKSLVALKLKVDVITPELGLLNGAEFVFKGMENVRVLRESEVTDRYLLGVQTMWHHNGLENYVSQVRYAPNINEVWKSGIPAHEVEINMAIARSLKYTDPTPSLYCNYDKVPSWSGHGKKNIGIHICRRYSHQFMANRMLQNTLEIGRMLHQEGHRVFIIGHEDAILPSDRDANTDFVYCLGRPLAEVAGLIRELDFMINEDSGIMHVTAAMDTPQIAIFGPTSDVKNSPWSDKAIVVRQGLDCAPCQYTERATNCSKNICMDIDASYIVQHVNNRL